ncbi:hypothetical protein M3Y98_01181400 [Aphelenchoides besseyi]|nr:hypothetical protein M3Y98_01181400 [Aphelenchoides besseyi]KAI6211079.1 hypothetical protein M3Y96_00395100 [Aphelenchoides besseyi]
MQYQNCSATMFINHYELFTDEFLQIYRNGQKFQIESRVEHLVQKRTSPGSLNLPIPTINMQIDQPVRLISSTNASVSSLINHKQNVEIQTSPCSSASSMSSWSSVSSLIENAKTNFPLESTWSSEFSSSRSNSTDFLSTSCSTRISTPTPRSSISELKQATRSPANCDTKIPTTPNDQLLQDIRSFSFANLRRSTIQRPKAQVKEQLSNPLLMSNTLHDQLNRIRERFELESDVSSQADDSTSFDFAV